MSDLIGRCCQGLCDSECCDVELRLRLSEAKGKIKEPEASDTYKEYCKYVKTYNENIELRAEVEHLNEQCHKLQEAEHERILEEVERLPKLETRDEWIAVSNVFPTEKEVEIAFWDGFYMCRGFGAYDHGDNAWYIGEWEVEATPQFKVLFYRIPTPLPPLPNDLEDEV